MDTPELSREEYAALHLVKEGGTKHDGGKPPMS